MLPQTNNPRLRFIQWKGHTLYVADFSNLRDPKEALALVMQSMKVVAQAPLHSVYAISDYTNAVYDANLVNEMRKTIPHFNLYLAAQAIVGMSAMQRIIFNNAAKLFRIRIYVAKSEVEAKDWLVERIREDEAKVAGNTAPSIAHHRRNR